jgi:alkanesulfonate monooxygenase SsuD/methylene tetrahydromethanopterin reductase-like flavin-dependent oxidoreductase (luciferase family)
MNIGIVSFPYSVREVAEIAATIDAADDPPLLGIPDSPQLFADTYVAQQAALGATRRLCAGPFCTNPVTRHWGVHAAQHRSLDELYPGRSFMGLAAGDSAVHAYGLAPAPPATMIEHVRAVRDAGPGELRVMVGAGGLKSVAAAGLACDEIVIGQGFDPGCVDELTAAAEAAREAAGIARPLKRWLYVLADLWEDGDGTDDPGEREAFLGIVMAYSRQAMAATYAGKNVPTALQGRLEQLYAGFSFEHYGSAENARLLESFEAERDFLTKRFAVAGTPQQVAEQLREGVAASAADGVWVGILTRNAPTATALFVERTLPALAAGS